MLEYKNEKKKERKKNVGTIRYEKELNCDVTSILHSFQLNTLCCDIHS